MALRVTMRDVGKAVGMSTMTVSRALRGDASVSKATRARVEEAARALGYVYDSTAQAFRTQKSGFVAVLLPSVDNANFADTFRALTDGFEDLGLQVLLGSTHYSLEREEDLVRQMLMRNPEALVLTGGAHTDRTRELVRAAGVPVIEMWDLPTDPLGHVVGFCNAEAMGQVVRHLSARGRRRLAFLGATGDTDARGAVRGQGALAAARAMGLPDMDVIDVGPAPVSMRQGQDAVARLGAAVRSYDGLVCVSDPVAFGALSAARRLGLAVPNDIAIAGFGNFEVAQVSDPRITTVDVNPARIGQRVVAMLRDVFASTCDDPVRIDVGTALVAGETS
ncbi:MAG: LacI family DNA-binding transcriptional regulator [Ruegeria sp.]